MGKWFNKSPNDLTSFFRGIDELAPLEELPTAWTTWFALLSSCGSGNDAGIMAVASYVPIRGRDRK